MVLGSRSGLMELPMRESGRITRLRGKEHSLILMEIITKENGMKIKPMDTAFLFIKKQEQDFKATGRMICSMAQVLRPIVMEISMKGCSRMVREMEKELITTQQERSIKEAGIMEESKAREFVFGLTARNMKVNGKIIKSTGKANIFGQMADNMRVTIEMIKNMA